MNRINRLILAGVLATGALSTAAVLASPEPDPIPSAWELHLAPSPLMKIAHGGRTYWYLLYTVTNKSSQDVDFHPEIARVNEIESELPADNVASKPSAAPRITVDPAIVGVDSGLFKAIAERHKKTYPFLTSPVDVISRILQGKDNAKTSVAVFTDLNPKISKFTIYFGGLSGERQTRPNPTYDPKKGDSDSEKNPRVIVLQKTLAMPYTLPGDERTRNRATPVLGRMTWVMR